MSYDAEAYKAAHEARDLLAAQIVCILRHARDLPDPLRARLEPLLDEHRKQEAAMDRALGLPEVTP